MRKLFRRGDILKVSRSRRVFLVLNALFVLLVCLAIALPIWMVVVTSFSSNEVAVTEGFVFIPKGFHLDSYQAVFSSSGYMGAFIRSIGVTIASTALSMALTTTMAYALAQKDLVFRNFFMNAVLLTMVVDGGIIPFYMVIRQMGMIDTYAAQLLRFPAGKPDGIRPLGWVQRAGDTLSDRPSGLSPYSGGHSPILCCGALESVF